MFTPTTTDETYAIAIVQLLSGLPTARALNIMQQLAPSILNTYHRVDTSSALWAEGLAGAATAQRLADAAPPVPWP